MRERARERERERETVSSSPFRSCLLYPQAVLGCTTSLMGGVLYARARSNLSNQPGAKAKEVMASNKMISSEEEEGDDEEAGESSALRQ